MPVFNASDVFIGQTYSNADYAFANLCIQDMRRNQRLPLNLSVEDIFATIVNQVDLWYDTICPYATVDDMLVFDLSLLNRANQYLDDTTDFKLLTDSVVLPGKVRAVYEAFYMGTGFLNRSSFSFAKWQLESIMLSSNVGLQPNYGADVYMESIFSTNLLQSMGREPVMYDYNQLNKVMRVYDHGDRTGRITCRVARDLPLSDLYSDPWFKRYIIGHTLDALADHIELFGSELPGNLSINLGVLRNRSEKLLDMVREQMQADTDTSLFMIKT